MLKGLRIALALLAIACSCTRNANAQWRVRIKALGGTPHAFSPPLNEPDDLPRMIGAHLSDIRKVLRQKGTGWTGRIEDLERAAQFAQVETYTLDPGKRIPWMAMRKHGRPTIYRPPSGMIWDGPAPLQAYSLLFASNGKVWRLVAPRACGNFWISLESSKLLPKIVADLDCFHEKQEIQFAPSPSPYGRDGLIMHDNDDFGDTAQREGWYWLGAWIRTETHQPWVDSPVRTLDFDAVERKLEPDQNGVFVRAPGKDPYGRAKPGDGNQNHGMTRDQLVPMIAALSVWGKQDALQRLWYALPEDILGKHDFQGHWHDFITGNNSYSSDPVNDIKNRDCRSPRGCPLKNDDRNCGFDVTVWPFGTRHFNNPFCEAAKAAQNAFYAIEKAACETLKLAEQAACEVQKGIDVVVATGKKETGLLLFVGDDGLPAGNLRPETYVLLVRAGVVPISIYPVTILAVSPAGLLLGEKALLGEILTLNAQANGHLSCTHGGCANDPGKLDCVDQDMNSIVMLWMSRHTIQTHWSLLAIENYKSRDHSYGSYFGQYCGKYGPLRVYPQECPVWEPDCSKDKCTLDAKLVERMKGGIGGGWTPDGRDYGPYGSVRWYNRWTVGANPRLAKLWEPIIADLVK